MKNYDKWRSHGYKCYDCAICVMCGTWLKDISRESITFQEGRSLSMSRSTSTLNIHSATIDLIYYTRGMNDHRFSNTGFWLNSAFLLGDAISSADKKHATCVHHLYLTKKRHRERDVSLENICHIAGIPRDSDGSVIPVCYGWTV